MDKNNKDYEELFLKIKNYVDLKKKLDSENWKKGDILTYIPTQEKVVLMKIHYDDLTPFYTIKMSDNREKQTVLEKLR